MSEESQNTTLETAEILRKFHERSQKNEPIHADNVLCICAIILIIGGVIGSFIVFNGYMCIVGALGSFITGVFYYVVGKIYATLREIRDK